jgi:hypothetical protein
MIRMLYNDYAIQNHIPRIPRALADIRTEEFNSMTEETQGTEKSFQGMI